MAVYNNDPSQAVSAFRRSVGTGNYSGSSGYGNGFGFNGGYGTGNAGYGYGYPGDRSKNWLANYYGLSDQEAGTSPYSWGGTSSGFGTSGYSTGASTGSTRGANVNNFTTLNNVKNPAFQDQLTSSLSDLSNSAFNPNVNPYVVRSNTKNPALDAATNALTNSYGNYINPTQFTKSGQYQQGIGGAYSQADADKQANRQQFNQFTNLFNSQTPGVTANVNQENNALGQVYNGGLQGTLDAQAAARAAAVNQSAQFALGRVNANNSLASMVGGNSSYLNKQMLDSAAQIRANEAIQQADLARSNTQYVLGQQAALNGVRDKNLDYLSNRQMVPVNYLQQLGSAEDARLAGIGGMDLSNNIYTTPYEQGSQRAGLLGQLSGLYNSNNFYQTDSAQQDLARRTAILSQLQGVNNANNFYGLQAPYTPDYSGGYPNNFGGGNNYGRGNSLGAGYNVNPYGGYGYQVNNRQTAPSGGLAPGASPSLDATGGIGAGQYNPYTGRTNPVAGQFNPYGQSGYGTPGWDGSGFYNNANTIGLGQSGMVYDPSMGQLVPAGVYTQ